MPYHDSEAVIAHSPYVLRVLRSDEDDPDRSDFIDSLTLRLNRARNCVDSLHPPAVESTEENNINEDRLGARQLRLPAGRAGQ